MEEFAEHKLRVAVIGLGKMGLLHASLLNVLPNVNLVAICDKSRIMRTVASAALKGPLITENLEDLMNLDLDAVYVTTPIPSHYGIIKEVYSQNIARNLFVEKTLTSRPSESEELCKLSSNLNGVDMVGYMKRFSVTFNKAKGLLSQDAIGQLLSFEAYAYSSDFADSDKNPSASPNRGGVLKDLGSHVVDLALWFFGDLEIESVKGYKSSAVGSVDSASFEVYGSRSLHGKFDVSWIAKGYRMPEFGLRIVGSQGLLTVDDSRLKLLSNEYSNIEWYRQDLSDNVPFLLAEPEYFRENKSFVDSIVSGAKVEPNFKTALKVDNLLGKVECKANEQ